MNAWISMLIPWIDVLGRSLLHFFWQGALIGLAYLLWRPFCRNVIARYRLGMSALLSMLALPLATLIWLWPSSGIAENTNAVTLPVFGDVIEATAIQFAHGFQWEPWFVGLWLFGVCLIATRSFLHWRRLTRLVREAVALPPSWQTLLEELCTRFRVARSVRLVSSLNIDTPTLIGWLKPVILLPASLFSGFSPAQIELIIAHELSHVRRFDYLANLAQVVIETLLFYHPVVHWISRDVRQARESCCDDLVLTLGGGNAVVYARTLADLEELHHDFGSAVPALGVGGGVLFARIRRIVDPLQLVSTDFPASRGNATTVPILLACVGVALALLRLHALHGSVADVVSQAPVQSIALLSGNPHLADARMSASAQALAASASPVASTADPVLPKTHVGEEIKVISVERLIEPAARPHIVLTSLAPADRSVADIRSQRVALAPIAIASVAETVSSPPTSVDTSIVAEQRTTDSALPIAAPADTASTGPVPERVVQPQYPTEALKARVTGKVDLDFRIAADGSVRDIRVLHSQPSGVFEQASIAALKQWHFADGGNTVRYQRSFAFTRADNVMETCREVTGSHICRRPVAESTSN